MASLLDQHWWRHFGEQFDNPNASCSLNFTEFFPSTWNTSRMPSLDTKLNGSRTIVEEYLQVVF